MQPHPQTKEREAIAQETIVAISTPPGRGGIGIVRLSGPHALEIAQGLIRMSGTLEPARARLAQVVDPDSGQKIDEAVATYFAKPHSYTGEDLVEIAAHGSPVILELLVRLALRGGARLARPGEFTERAFLSGRLDLTQAEAVRDLIEAQTLYQARIAAEQMGGALSRRVQPPKQKLVELIALLEAGIDFAEDDVEVTPDEEIVTRIDTIAVELAVLARSFEHGRMVHAGLRLAIVGRPNVGKSSLFNRLLERDRAIVTASPGTTRDLVTDRLSVGGIPVELVDTAGLLPTAGSPAMPAADIRSVECAPAQVWQGIRLRAAHLSVGRSPLGISTVLAVCESGPLVSEVTAWGLAAEGVSEIRGSREHSIRIGGGIPGRRTIRIGSARLV